MTLADEIDRALRTAPSPPLMASGTEVVIADKTDPTIYGADLARQLKASRLQRLTIRGAVVDGPLDLALCSVASAVEFENCVFSDPVILDGAELLSIGFFECQIAWVSARQANVKRRCSFVGTTMGGLDLTSSTIGGNLELSKTSLNWAEKPVPRTQGVGAFKRSTTNGRLLASLVEVGGFIDGTDLLAARGLDLSGAVVDDSIKLHGAHLQVQQGNPDPALDLSLSTAVDLLCTPWVEKKEDADHRSPGGGDVPIRWKEFCATGEVRLNGAKFSGSADFSGAQLTARSSGLTLCADTAEFANLRCSTAWPSPSDDVRFRSKGQVRLIHTVVSSELDLSGARLEAIDEVKAVESIALRAQGLEATVLRCGPVRERGSADRARAEDADAKLPDWIPQPLDVDGSVILDDGEFAWVEFAEALIRGRPNARYAALSLIGVTVKSDLLLTGAQITGSEITKADTPATPATDVEVARAKKIEAAIEAHGHVGHGAAVDARRLIAGAVLAGSTTSAPCGLRLVGILRIDRAQLSGPVNLRGAALDGSGGAALSAVGASFVKLDCRLGSERFTARGAIDCAGATASRHLSFGGAVLRAPGDRSGGSGVALNLDRVTADAIDLSSEGEATRVFGQLTAESAKVRHRLDLRGVGVAAPRGPDGSPRPFAVSLDGAEIDAISASLDGRGRPFWCIGGVRMRRASVRGDADFRGARLMAATDALDADGAGLTDLLLTSDGDRRLVARGTIRLIGAKVANRLNLSSASITGPLRRERASGSMTRQAAVRLDRSLIGLLSCHQASGPDRKDGPAFETVGALEMISAKVTGQARISRARLNVGGAADCVAVRLDDASFGELVIYKNNLVGETSMLGAVARRLLSDEFGGVKRWRWWEKPSPPPSRADDASGTEGSPPRADDASSTATAPPDPDISKPFDLSGLTYGRWDQWPHLDPGPGLGEVGWELRAVEQASGVAKSLQPFEQLAKVLRTEGREADARATLQVREKHVTRLRKREISRNEYRFRSHCAKKAIYSSYRRAYFEFAGYGYSAWRALGTLALLFLLSLGLSCGAQHAGAFELRSEAKPTPIRGMARCIPVITAVGAIAPLDPPVNCVEPTVVDVEPVVLATERLIPFIDLGERGRVRAVGWYGIGLGLVTVCGWLFTLALIASLNKTLRRD